MSFAFVEIMTWVNLKAKILIKYDVKRQNAKKTGTRNA